MHDRMILDPVVPGAVTAAEMGRVADYLQHEKAASTREAYEADWKQFAAWCLGRGLTPLPAEPGVTAVYLLTLADAGKKASTIARKLCDTGTLIGLCDRALLDTVRGVRAVELFKAHCGAAFL